LKKGFAAEGIQLEEEVSMVFGCSEKGCIEVYQSHSSLKRHLDAGKHLMAYEREFNVGRAKNKWAETCRSISGIPSVSHSQSEDAPQTAGMGWALKRPFHHQVRKFLREVFLQGEDIGNKATGEDITARIKCMRTAEGTKVLSKDEWLTST